MPDEKDITMFLLSKAAGKLKEIVEKDPKWQEGFTAGCRFMSDLCEEFKNRERDYYKQHQGN